MLIMWGPHFENHWPWSRSQQDKRVRRRVWGEHNRRLKNEEREWLIVTANFSDNLFWVSTVQRTWHILFLLILATNCRCHYYFQFTSQENLNTLGKFPGHISITLNPYPAISRVQPLANTAVPQFWEVFCYDVLGSRYSFKVSNQWCSKAKVIIRINYFGRIVQCLKSERMAIDLYSSNTGMIKISGT